MYIVFDLDDTLLTSDKKITDYTRNVLDALQKKGHKLVINTARSLSFCEKIIDEVNADYAVLNAGALVVDNKKEIIFADIIPLFKTIQVIEKLRPISKRISVESLGGMYSSSMTYANQSSKYFDFFTQQFSMPCFKILAYVEDEKKAKKIAEEHELDFMTYLGGYWRRYTTINSTKWRGLKFVLDRDRISYDDAIAFGDDIGDLEMLLNVKYGVAMKNSKPAVLEQIKLITDTNDNDGVAKYLDEFFK